MLLFFLVGGSTFKGQFVTYEVVKVSLPSFIINYKLKF